MDPDPRNWNMQSQDDIRREFETAGGRIDDREAQRLIIEAERSDDSKAVEIYLKLGHNRRRGGGSFGLTSAVLDLCGRLQRANRAVAAGTNYTCDREVCPRRVEFANGRVVRIIWGDEGPYLDIDRR